MFRLFFFYNLQSSELLIVSAPGLCISLYADQA